MLKVLRCITNGRIGDYSGQKFYVSMFAVLVGIFSRRSVNAVAVMTDFDAEFSTRGQSAPFLRRTLQVHW